MPPIRKSKGMDDGTAGLDMWGTAYPLLNVGETPYHINVGGTTYTTTLSTLTRYPNSKLASLFNGMLQGTVNPPSGNQYYFIDRDGGMFRHILNFLRNGELLVGEDFKEFTLLLKEAEYFGIDELVVEIVTKSFASQNIKSRATSTSVDDSGPVQTNGKDSSVAKVYEKTVAKDGAGQTEHGDSVEILDLENLLRKTLAKKTAIQSSSTNDLIGDVDKAGKSNTSQMTSKNAVTTDVAVQINSELTKTKTIFEADVLYALTDSTGYILEIWSSDGDIRSKIKLPHNPNSTAHVFGNQTMKSSFALKLRVKHCFTCSGVFKYNASYCYDCQKPLQTCPWYQDNELPFMESQKSFLPSVAKCLLQNGYKLVSCTSMNVEEKHYVFDFEEKFVLYHCFVKQ